MKRILYLFICLFPIIGCNNTLKPSKVAAKIDGTVLTLDVDSTQTHSVSISIGQLASFSTSIRGGEGFNIMDSLKLNKLAHYELAYTLAQNEGLLDAHISILNKLDTTLQCQFKYSEIWEHKGEITSGKFAKIVNTFDSNHIDSELRRWVYKNKKINIGETLFNAMRLYLRELSVSTNTELIVKGEIPSVKSEQLKGSYYKVSSDMVADNYFIFACDADEDLDYFVEEMIARNMADAQKTLSNPLKCFRQNNATSVQCLFLVGINNDWTSQVIPLGLISVDNEAPSYGKHSSYQLICPKLYFPKRGFTINVDKHPDVTGWWNVSNGDWQGRGLYIRVPFTFTWSGDVSKFVFNRGDNNFTTINLEGKESPYHIDISCKIELGDNYYEVKAYDKLGNYSKYDYHIGAAEVKDEKPQIDIDNNIWN